TAMVIVKGAAMEVPGVPFLPVKFNFFADHGEGFFAPYYHRNQRATWCLGFTIQTGAGMDRFDGCTSGEQALAAAKAIIPELMPWEAAWGADAELADTNGWLVGAVTPTIRDPVGRLPSGRVVMPLGDTAMSLDPIGGQGANLGNKFARHIVA